MHGAKTPATDPEDLSIAKSHLHFPVVGIGASAGGLSALRRLLLAMPAKPGMAFVVVVHLSPDHESLLGDILQRSTSMVVETVAESKAIQPDHVYVISPSSKLTMTDGSLRVSAMSTIEGRRQSIDLFFRSLAQAHRERAICLVLSGTGGDGSQGLKRIKELGGVAIAQSPDDAEFDGMPRHAIQTGLVDFTLPVTEIPQKLVTLWANARAIALPAPPPDFEARTVDGEAGRLADEALRSVMALLRERTGHDFANYKRGTVLRRLERRMQVNAVPDLPSYRRLLDTEPAETQALLQDMLISVTNFFRDPEAFEALRQALRAQLPDRAAPRPPIFRAWVAGCASGEEAYSVAILLHELLADAGTPIQVFASDIDRRAIAAARTGFYPMSIVTDVSEDRLRRFFTPEPGGFRITKAVRDSVVFSVHNLLSDPAFTRMDLICCRNLLIYLDRVAQAKALHGFHFALMPRGLLFLGSSETTDAADGLFASVDKSRRIYRPEATATTARPLPPLPLALPRMPVIEEPARPPSITGRSALDALHERVLRNHAPPTALVDAGDTALHVSERAAHLLRLPAGAPTNKLLELARPELRAELRAAIARSAEAGRSVQAPGVRLLINGQPRIVTITAHPAHDETPKGLTLVVFDECDESMAPNAQAVPGRDPVVDSLEAELMRTQEQLRGLAGQSAASTEELRASNEELQTINEELRSTTEELETSREELQSVNEELTTVNAELGAKVEETGKVSDDLHNLMASTEIGTVFVDREMRIKRFTPQAALLFNLLPSDVGRPLMDIRHKLDYPELEADAQKVLRDLGRVEREVRCDGRWFLARALPYRTSENRIEGAVLAFVDVTERRAAEEELRRSEQRMRLVAKSMRDYAIVTTDERGVITSWSPGAERMFGYDSQEAVGASIAMIYSEEDRERGEPQAELLKAREAGRSVDDRWHVGKDGQRVFCSGITTPLIDTGLIGFAKIARDFTLEEPRERQRDADLLEERAKRGRLEEASEMKDEFLAVMSHELKNPLAVIQMNAQLLARLPAFRAEPRAERVASAIQSAVASQAQIINDLLELSRINTGKVAIEPSRLDLAKLVDSIVEAVGPDAAAKGQRITTDIAAPMWAMADAVRVEQMVWNLVTNAVKFTPEGGQISVRLTADVPVAELVVADSGIGIDAADLLAVFQMFRQVETGANRRQTGLGIGLALVKQLAELHGGRVEARSEGLGRGSKFHVWLPVVEAQAAAGRLQASASGDNPLAGARLLLVDDEPELLMAFAELLRLEGATVAVAESAPRALELAAAEPFDAVVSDVAMPEHDGYWLAGELRRLPATRGLPLIAVSGRAREADQKKALEAGFDAHLGKPMPLDALREALRVAARRRGAPGTAVPPTPAD